MDPAMKSMYRIFNGLDVDSCVELPRPYSKLELQLVGEDKPKPMIEFIRECAQLVTIDQLSSRPLAEKLTREGFPQFAHLFVEIVVEYAVFRYKDQAVGHGYNILFYNGYPAVLSPEYFDNLDFLKSPEKFDVNALTSKMSESDAMAEPVRGVFPHNFLSRDFLNQNPVYLKSKSWGINRRELWAPPSKE